MRRSTLLFSLLLLALLSGRSADAASRPDCPAPRLAGGGAQSGSALAACRDSTKSAEGAPIDVLVFSRTAGFRHDSIGAAVDLLTSLSPGDGIRVEATEDPSVFRDEVLAQFDVVLFANTTGDVLDDAQQAAMERFIRSGRGYVGAHSAADTEYDWPWYGRLVGAYFRSHPLLPVEVEVTTEDPDHRSTAHFRPTFLFTDEIYNFDRNPRQDHQILLTVDEEGFIYPNTDGGPSMGEDHPIAWYKEFEGGRSFYTNLGHRPETWRDPVFVEHLLEGIRWAADRNRWSRIVLTDLPRNPLAMDVAPDGRVFWVERAGDVRIWDPATGRVAVAARIDVSRTGENGLLGIALSPTFASRPEVYLYYAAPDPEDLEVGVEDEVGENRLSRFRMDGPSSIDLESEEILLRVPSARGNHEAGDLEFGPDGKLYLSIGDNTNPFGDTQGFAPRDNREGHLLYDAERTAQNPHDLRGAILRLNRDGTPALGNLYAAGEGRPEIYVKGTRNPFRIALDPVSGRLFWGDVGPDAFFDGPRGPRGYDEINFADSPGNYGWPRCIGFNRAYADYDFARDEVGPPLSCDGFRPAALAYDYLTTDYLALGRAFQADDEDDTGRTAIGGVVYRTGQNRGRFALPAEYEGDLLMAEWTRDLLVALDVSATGEVGEIRRLLPWLGLVRPIDLAIAPDGALYVLEFGSQFGGDNPDARLSRIEYSEEGRLSPIARIEASATAAAEVPATLHFSGAASTAPNGEVVGWEWDFDGDGAVDARGAEVDHAFGEAGVFDVSLVVQSASGTRSFAAVRRVLVGNSPPHVTMEEPAPGTVFTEGAEVVLRGAAVDAEDGEIPCTELVWDVRLGHNAHAHPVAEIRGCEVSFVPALGDHGPARNLFYVVELRATDGDGPGDDAALTGSVTRVFPIQLDSSTGSAAHAAGVENGRPAS